MSGRDLRSFLSQHRSGTFYVPSKNVAAELTKKYVCGVAHGRGRSIDYEELLNKAKGHKETASRQLRHVARLTHQSKERKAAELLNLHREVWTKEMHKLQREMNGVECELEQWRNANLTDSARHMESTERKSGDMWVEIAECEMELVSEKRHFELCSMKPLKEVTLKLKNWVKARDKAESKQVGVVSRVELMRELTLTQEQLRISWRELEGEYASLDGHLASVGGINRGQRGVWGMKTIEGAKEEDSGDELGMLGFLDFSGEDESVEWVESSDSVAGEEHRGGVVGGVPAALLGCSSGELCASLAEELASLDVHYKDRLRQLRDRHQHTLSCHDDGGWSAEDACRFKFIMDHYSEAMRGHSRRELYLDRLAREFPQRSRQHLVEHEKWVWSCQAYHRQRCAVLRDWYSQRAGLEGKITAAVTEYEQERASKEVKLRCHEQQLQLCRALHEKVREWREERVRQAHLEEEQAASLKAEQEVWLKEEKERQRRNEARTKGRILSYRQQQEAELERERLEEEQLRLVAQEERMRRAGQDQQRVEHRKQLLLERLAQHREQKEAREEEERERERQLDHLRQQVAVVADSDPDRLLQHTQATQARLEPSEATPSSFLPVHSYTAHQVTSDPRVKLEVALREAGLLQNDYARYMLSRAPPPSNPRPDQRSSLFKDC